MGEEAKPEGGEAREEVGTRRSIFAAGFVFGLVVGVLATPILVDKVEFDFDSLTRAVSAAGIVLGATIASLALFYAHGQLNHAQHTARVDRTSALASRFTEPEFARSILEARSITGVSPESQEGTWVEYRKNDEMRRKVNTIWNYFDQLGMAFNHGLLDRHLVKAYLGYASLSLYDEHAWMIDRQKALHPTWEGPQEWEQMNRQLR